MSQTPGTSISQPPEISTLNSGEPDQPTESNEDKTEETTLKRKQADTSFEKTSPAVSERKDPFTPTAVLQRSPQPPRSVQKKKKHEARKITQFFNQEGGNSKMLMDEKIGAEKQDNNGGADENDYEDSPR